MNDFNGDGSLDIAAAHFHPDCILVFPGNGDGTFGSEYQLSTNGRPHYLASCDFDLDGDRDLAAVTDGDNVSILLNDSGGNFTMLAGFWGGAGPSGLAAGDFDGDGDCDLAVTNLMLNRISVMINTTAD